MIVRFITTLFFFFFVKVFSQGYSKLYNTYKAKYPDAHQVILEKQAHLTIDIVDGELKIFREIFEDILLLNTSSSFDVKKSISTSSFYGLGNIEAATLVYKKGKYRKIEVETFTEKDNTGNNFYDDTKILSFKYPNLEQGARKIVRYKEEIKNPRFINSVFFASSHPIAKLEYTIKANKKVLLKFKEFNLENIDIQHTQKASKGKNSYHWIAENIEGLKLEGGTPDFRYFIPHIAPIIESYTVNNKEITLTKSPKDLYHWYYSLVKDINKESSDADMIRLVKEITKNKKTNLDKVKAIYYWVQENIKYIAFEYALGGFIPRDANKVFIKKYGDCKDNSSILYEMLKIAGLEGNLTWIGTRSIPYSYYELPTPAVDNHMILSYIEGENTYYLDATGRYLPIELPSSFIQGKEALIGKGEHQFEIKKVPVVSARINTVIDSSYFKLNEDLDIEGSGSFSLSGYPKIDFYFQQEQLKTDDQRIDYYKKNLQKGNNNFIVKGYKENNIYSYDKDFKLDYDFVIKNYVQHIGDDIYINLNMNTDILDYKSQKKRTYDREFEYKASFKYVNTLEVPNNVTLDYIPENFTISNTLVDCNITYKQKGNTLTNTLEIVQKFILITPQQQETLNKLITEIQQQLKEVIVLKKNK